MKGLDAGSYIGRLPCPACHVVIEVPFIIGARLTMDDDQSSIRVKIGQKAVLHTCGQGHLFAVPTDDDDDQGDDADRDTDPGRIPGQLRADDWAERQAGGRDT